MPGRVGEGERERGREAERLASQNALAVQRQLNQSDKEGQGERHGGRIPSHGV